MAAVCFKVLRHHGLKLRYHNATMLLILGGFSSIQCFPFYGYVLILIMTFPHNCFLLTRKSCPTTFMYSYMYFLSVFYNCDFFSCDFISCDFFSVTFFCDFFSCDFFSVHRITRRRSFDKPRSRLLMTITVGGKNQYQLFVIAM